MAARPKKMPARDFFHEQEKRYAASASRYARPSPHRADSHAHLDSEGIIERLPEVMGRARSTGLASIGQVFLGPAAYHANKDTFAGYPGVFFLMGIHPCDGQECTGAHPQGHARSLCRRSQAAGRR